MHGPHAIIEEVLDWRPFDYLTISTLLPMPDAPKVIMSYAFLEEKPGATHIEIRLAGRSRRTRRFSIMSVAEFQKTSAAKIEKAPARMLEDRTGRRPQSKSRCCRCRAGAFPEPSRSHAR